MAPQRRGLSWVSAADDASSGVAQIIQKPSGSKIAMLKAEVDILTKCNHPNV